MRKIDLYFSLIFVILILEIKLTDGSIQIHNCCFMGSHFGLAEAQQEMTQEGDCPLPGHQRLQVVELKPGGQIT